MATQPKCDAACNKGVSPFVTTNGMEGDGGDGTSITLYHPPSPTGDGGRSPSTRSVVVGDGGLLAGAINREIMVGLDLEGRQNTGEAFANSDGLLHLQEVQDSGLPTCVLTLSKEQSVDYLYGPLTVKELRVLQGANVKEVRLRGYMRMLLVRRYNRLTPGQVVRLHYNNEEYSGVVRWKCDLPENVYDIEPEWALVLIHLSSKYAGRGSNDGVIDKRRYFACRKNSAMLIPLTCVITGNGDSPPSLFGKSPTVDGIESSSEVNPRALEECLDCVDPSLLRALKKSYRHRHIPAEHLKRKRKELIKQTKARSGAQAVTRASYPVTFIPVPKELIQAYGMDRYQRNVARVQKVTGVCACSYDP
ncbi:hypothetical protein RvY_00153 [Ramazzottius varieornatus]|uniref:CAP-Gly domain-containing protein n=1 Tax=Ramazzottius varieornatus TaxID=947166 RepID=A0A1D1UBQ1_RAMVA|nr:hypothetical protein RvY_00153 [Ramazzottius varieornatus]